MLALFFVRILFTKKELLKKFKVIVDDLMDHYEEYTEEEKSQIKEIFQKVATLNTILDKYDMEVKFDWEEYLAEYISNHIK